MLEDVERQLGELRQLLLSPTGENLEAANQKLSGVARALQAFASEESAIAKRSAGDTALLRRLPSEMAHIEQLFQAPVRYLEGLGRYRAQRFGSYNCQGEMKGLGQSARTLTHL